jgi:hypothetical protein
MRSSAALVALALLGACAGIVAVGVMTDSGDDGATRRTFYDDITFRSGE